MLWTGYAWTRPLKRSLPDIQNSWCTEKILVWNKIWVYLNIPNRTMFSQELLQPMQKSEVCEQELEKYKLKSSGEINERNLFTKLSFSVGGDCTSILSLYDFTRKIQKRKKTQQNSTRGSVLSAQAALDSTRDRPKTVMLADNNQGRSLLSNYTF